jgi:Gnt-I system high-affinity gluconate transporter
MISPLLYRTAHAGITFSDPWVPAASFAVALIQQYHADLGLTLLYGFIIAVPSIIIAGPLFATTLKKYTRKPLATFAGKKIAEAELPGIAASFITALLPVVLIGAQTIIKMVLPAGSLVVKIFAVLGDPAIALLLTLAYAIYALVLKRGKKLEPCMNSMTDAAKDISLILLIIAGAGALKQVLTESGTAAQLTQLMKDCICIPACRLVHRCFYPRLPGSATVAGLTAAGMIAPMIAGTLSVQAFCFGDRRRKPYVFPCERFGILVIQRVF